MAKFIDKNTLKFQVWDVHNSSELFNSDYYGDHNKEELNMFLDSIYDFSAKELFPYFQEMDEKPAYFDGSVIKTHDQVAKIFRAGVDLGIIASQIKAEDGGLQIPLTIHTAATAIMDAANNSIPGYAGLTLGALELILDFGSDELKEKYTEQMMSGNWAGTMCLTEPQAGSSLSDIVTTAYPQEDGTYKIKGQKIFISGGDHEHVENVIHLLLARIEGAPAGTKGISLFTVPKYNENGKPNDVLTAGEFKKMGQKGYCTTHLMFGENDNCVAEIVGTPNHGLKYMFRMMNGARIAVGRGAAAIAMAAYEASLKYANERSQGRRINDDGSKNLAEGQTLIINHPDVRRLLLSQKAIAEGGMSLVFQASIYYDLMNSTDDPKENEKYNILLELLTPMAKTYPSEKGNLSVSNGIQVLGGYGFVTEYSLQQYYRDIRIFALYEGTTGIQSIDLLGRKMTMNDGIAPQLLAQEINKTLMEAREIEAFKPYVDQLGRRLKDVVDIMEFLSKYANEGKFNTYLADASLFMEYFSTVCVAWQWLKTGVKAHQYLISGQTSYSKEFLQSKIHTMKYFFLYELKATNGLKDIIMDSETLTVKTDTEIII